MTTVLQICPRLDSGGIERGAVDLAIALKEHGYNSILVSGGGFLEKELQEYNVSHITLPAYSKNPVIFILNLFRLSKILRKIKPDIVHPHSRIPTWLVYFLSKNMPLKWLSSCNGIHSLDKFGFKKIYNGVLTKGKIVIANSEFTKNYLIQNYTVKPESIQVIYRGIDFEKLKADTADSTHIQQLRASLNIPAEKKIVLLAARFADWKGQRVFVEACHALKTRNQLKFVGLFVGSTKNLSYTQIIKDLIKSYGLEDELHILGETQDIKSFYALSDLILSTSIKPEAFGRSIVEAQAMRKPVIATAHGGACETIVDGETGWLCKPNDPEALAQAIIKFFALSAHENELVLDAALKRVTQLFSKDSMCQHYIACYQAMLLAGSNNESC